MPLRLERFLEGYRTCDDLVRDRVRSARREKPVYSSGEHRAGIAALDETDAWQSIGYLSGTAVNCFKHPIIMYYLFFIDGRKD